MSKPFNEADHPRHSNGRFDNKPEAATSGADLGGGQHLPHPAPSVEDDPAEIEYYKNGQVESEHYLRDGKYHREDGPASIWYDPDGQVRYEYYYRDGELHREDGPAEIAYNSDGQVHAERHYLNGTATPDGQPRPPPDYPCAYHPHTNMPDAVHRQWRSPVHLNQPTLLLT